MGEWGGLRGGERTGGGGRHPKKYQKQEGAGIWEKGWKRGEKDPEEEEGNQNKGERPKRGERQNM